MLLSICFWVSSRSVVTRLPKEVRSNLLTCFWVSFSNRLRRFSRFFCSFSNSSSTELQASLT